MGGHAAAATYQFFGQAFERHAPFVNMSTREPLLVTTAARQSGFKRVGDAAVETLRSRQIRPVN